MKKPEVRVAKYVQDLDMYVVEYRPRYVGAHYGEEWSFVYAFSDVNEAIAKANEVYETMVEQYKKQMKDEYTFRAPDIIYAREFIFSENENEEAN